MKLSRFLWLLIPTATSAASFGGCGAGAEGLTSTSSSFAVSVSASSSSGGSPDGGAGGASGAGHIALACTSDAVCGADLVCLRDTNNDPIFGGGAPSGFCTKVCSADADCASAGGVCYKVDPNQPGRCTLSCTFGPPITGIPGLFDALQSAKCLGREDVRCAESIAGDGVCVPTCGEDAQCGGRFCDPRLAVCVDMPSLGYPTGAACDPLQTPTACAGVCIGFKSGLAMCSRPCVLGGKELKTSDCGGPEQGLCAFHPTPNGAGDTGFCTPACTAQSDCQTPSFWCFSVPTLTEKVQKGYCFAASACPNGQPDCDAAGYVCAATPSGPLCLDPKFPPTNADAGASDAGPSDGGNGDAGKGDAGSGDAGKGDAGIGDAGDGG